MMGDIYKNAEHVLVWLGPTDVDSGLGLDLIRDLGKSDVDCMSTNRTCAPGDFDVGAEWEKAFVWFGCQWRRQLTLHNTCNPKFHLLTTQLRAEIGRAHV